MASAHADITGILLAGGQSRRMGGGDKGLLKLAGKTMLQHVIDRMAGQVPRQVQSLAINANGDANRFTEYGLPVFPDTMADHPGPLAGILAGMQWARENTKECQWIATVSTDAPFLPSNLIEKLHEAASANPGAIAIASSEGHVHPVIGLWPVRHADDLHEALLSGVRKVLAWTDRHGTVPVDFPLEKIGEDGIDPFFNANTPEELEVARQLLARTS